ncbi:hypothetical protein BEK98_02475 [Streptomyces diastatochromogenes]|uniref:Uncharacterized protein n=2 Tax=Streptomyces diastatochromogenes TaxID=42236 RepID=A0A233SV51_STRDA|nr:hypothetical protein [Streptomyces diastatochromogenes]OXY99530.1 hypothetical protein BEK98_02475 [Streptomyces diastatochromogenes]
MQRAWEGTLGTDESATTPFPKIVASNDGHHVVVWGNWWQLRTAPNPGYGELVAPLHLWSPWRRLRVGAGTVSAESQLGRVTLSLEPPRHGPGSLCGVRADYPVAGGVGHLLRSDEPVPAAADTRPPCRNHP